MALCRGLLGSILLVTRVVQCHRSICPQEKPKDIGLGERSLSLGLARYVLESPRRTMPSSQVNLRLHCTLAGISFLFPQPPYLGPSKLTLLNSEVCGQAECSAAGSDPGRCCQQEFDEQVLLLPPDGPGGIKSKIKEVETGDLVRNRSHLVLFHADWIRKSRELEITLSRLSWSLSPLSLSRFFLAEALP